jgi:molybdopterin/thiamine biosynthesis adenylyltransferase
MSEKIVIIGLGGIGSILLERMARYLNFARMAEDMNREILLVDGDSYEDKNLERQEFRTMGNKASVKADEIDMQYRNIKIDDYPAYINDANIADVIRERDTVFMCVDNHKTRMIVSNYCSQLKEVTLISGGNEFFDGNVQIYVRRDGVDLTPDLCRYHPEIQNPDDKLPEEMSCEELAESDPQLYFTNLGVATIMCWAFYNVVIQGDLERSEVYFDMRQMTADAKIRLVK